MDGIDYGAVFGIEQGAKEQDAAAPAENRSPDAQGVKEQESAGPAVGNDISTELSKAEASAESADTEKPAAKQNTQDNAAFAAARRKAEAERDRAVAEAKKEAEKYIDDAFKTAGLRNPYTDKPITNKADYEEYKARFDADKKERFLKKSGMSQKEFNEFIETLPEVARAKQAEARARNAQKEAEEISIKAKVEEQLREISALDPKIKSLDDLQNMPNYAEFYARVKRGLTLTEAFKLTNFDEQIKGTARRAEQAARNAAAGKSHMTATSTRGTGAASVPSDVKEMYKALNPNATDAEIAEHYNRNRKGNG